MSAQNALIDFHSHILPGADHGSSCTKESLNQLELMHQAGVATVVATPHFYPNQHRPEDHLRMLAVTAEKLASRPHATPRICLGAEVLYCDGLENMENLNELCIRGTNVLLLELPFGPWSAMLFDTVSALCGKYTLVLAHIDRYLAKHSSEIEELLSLGALAQINADALTGFFSRRRLAPFLRDDRLVALGSDLHGDDPKSYAPLVSAKKHLGDKHDEIMLRSAELLKSAETI